MREVLTAEALLVAVSPTEEHSAAPTTADWVEVISTAVLTAFRGYSSFAVANYAFLFSELLQNRSHFCEPTLIYPRISGAVVYTEPVHPTRLINAVLYKKTAFSRTEAASPLFFRYSFQTRRTLPISSSHRHAVET